MLQVKIPAAERAIVQKHGVLLLNDEIRRWMRDVRDVHVRFCRDRFEHSEQEERSVREMATWVVRTVAPHNLKKLEFRGLECSSDRQVPVAGAYSGLRDKLAAQQ